MDTILLELAPYLLFKAGCQTSLGQVPPSFLISLIAFYFIRKLLKVNEFFRSFLIGIYKICRIILPFRINKLIGSKKKFKENNSLLK